MMTAATLRRRMLAALPLAVVSTFALATLAVSYLPRTRSWTHAMAHTEAGPALYSTSYGVGVVVHDPGRVTVSTPSDDEPRTAFVTAHGYALEDRLAVRPLPGWARAGNDPRFPARGVAGLPLACFRFAASPPKVAPPDPIPPGSVRFRGAIAIGSPTIAYGRPATGVLIPYAIRPAPFVTNVLLLTLAWMLLITAFARTWRLGMRVLRPRRGRCPTCGYDLTDTPTPACPECGATNETPAPAP